MRKKILFSMIACVLGLFCACSESEDAFVGGKTANIVLSPEEYISIASDAVNELSEGEALGLTRDQKVLQCTNHIYHKL